MRYPDEMEQKLRRIEIATSYCKTDKDILYDKKCMEEEWDKGNISSIEYRYWQKLLKQKEENRHE